MGLRTQDLVDSSVAMARGVLPDGVAHTVALMVLDGLACGIAGAACPEFRAIGQVVGGEHGSGAIPAPGGRRLGCAGSALLDGIAIHILDFDDVQKAFGHPTATLLPAALSIGYQEHCSFDEIIRAFVVGAEIEVAIANAMNPSHYRIGWHPTSVIGVMGASMVAGTLLGLERAQLHRTLGMAACFAAGTRANFGTEAKSVQVGNASRCAVEAAMLVRAGVGANDHILDPQTGGFLELFSSEVPADTADAGAGASAGRDPVLAGDAVMFKRFPCCASIAPAILAVQRLREQWHVTPEDVVRLRTVMDETRLGHTNRPQVSDELDAKFSVQYCTAVALVTGSVGLEDFEPGAVHRSGVRDLMERMEVGPGSPDTPHLAAVGTGVSGRWARVEVLLGDGSSLRCEIGVDGTERSGGFREEAVVQKFLECTGRAGRAPGEAEAVVGELLGSSDRWSWRDVVEWSWDQ